MPSKVNDWESWPAPCGREHAGVARVTGERAGVEAFDALDEAAAISEHAAINAMPVPITRGLIVVPPRSRPRSEPNLGA